MCHTLCDDIDNANTNSDLILSSECFLLFSIRFLQEVPMNFHKGDMVMHWTYGMGQIVNLEERVLSGSKLLYYEVHVQDLSVWVPADGKVSSRLRSPTPKLRFKRILTILSEPSDPLPEDRLERKKRLQE